MKTKSKQYETIEEITKLTDNILIDIENNLKIEYERLVKIKKSFEKKRNRKFIKEVDFQDYKHIKRLLSPLLKKDIPKKDLGGIENEIKEQKNKYIKDKERFMQDFFIFKKELKNELYRSRLRKKQDIERELNGKSLENKYKQYDLELENKVKYIGELESKISTLENTNNKLSTDNDKLRFELKELQEYFDKYIEKYNQLKIEAEKKELHLKAQIELRDSKIDDLKERLVELKNKDAV